MRRDGRALRRLGGALLWLLVATLLLLALPATPVHAAPGDLDVSFSGDGLQTVDAGAADTARAVAIQPDGKIVIAGYAYTTDATGFAVTRLNADGSLDAGFGVLGVAKAYFAGVAYGRALVLQPDGRIVVAGYEGSDFAIARFTAAGVLDTSFSGDGMQTVDFAGAIEQAWALARQSDGRLIMGGSSGPSSTTDFALARLNTDGSLDTTFSGDGRATADITGGDSVRALAIQSDGRIVAAGAAGTLYQRDFGIARFATDGSLDLTFSGDGKTTTTFGDLDYAEGVAVQSDGRIVAAGYTDGAAG
jgi:uncharacterized delta-60 repeat protein